MRKKVLYIEDEVFFANIISKNFIEEGFEVMVKKDGESGVKEAKNIHYDVIFLDLLLPKMGGFDVLRQLRENESTKNTPIVILSNISSESDKKKAKELGATKYCIKMSTYPQHVVALAKELVGT